VDRPRQPLPLRALYILDHCLGGPSGQISLPPELHARRLSAGRSAPDAADSARARPSPSRDGCRDPRIASGYLYCVVAPCSSLTKPSIITVEEQESKAKLRRRGVSIHGFAHAKVWCSASRANRRAQDQPPVSSVEASISGVRGVGNCSPTSTISAAPWTGSGGASPL
jgi:hypothetical protein